MCRYFGGWRADQTDGIFPGPGDRGWGQTRGTQDRNRRMYRRGGGNTEDDTEGKYILERDKQNGYVLESNYVWMRLGKEVLWCWCLWRLRWWGLNDLQVMMIRAQVKSGAGVRCDWLVWRTDRFVTHIGNKELSNKHVINSWNIGVSYFTSLIKLQFMKEIYKICMWECVKKNKKVRCNPLSNS